jgi:membrane protein implicated in regulation of membrane protease activity
MTAAIIVAVGAAVAFLAPLVFDHLTPIERALLMIAVLAIEPLVNRRQNLRTGQDGAHALHRGRMGTVTHSCHPTGRVTVDGTSWTARCIDDRGLEPGECVYIHHGDGLTLLVSREEARPK